MRALLNLGPVVSPALDPLTRWVEAVPRERWVYRGDPESDRTCVLTPLATGAAWQDAATLVAALLEDAAGQHFRPGYTNRLVLSCVPAGEKILPHEDDFGEAVRSRSFHCHIPIVTHEEAVMGFGDGSVEHLKRGHLYVLDETTRHFVDNPSALDRVHLLFAYFPHAGKYELEPM